MAGPTSCGKSTFIFNFINNLDRICDTEIAEIYYALPVGHKINLNQVKEKVIILNGLPDSKFFNNNIKKLLIIDDFSNEKKELEKITHYFTRVSHHTSTSIIFVTQNIFEKGLRTINLNTHYLVLFKNPRDNLQIKMLARQIFPNNPQALMEAYSNSTSALFGYLVIDMTPGCHDALRLRTKIFPQEALHTIIYTCTENYPSTPIKIDI